MQFAAYELELPDPIAKAREVDRLRAPGQPPLLILDTCQRLEIFGVVLPPLNSAAVTGQWMDASAFERLARIAAGLESRVLGELEILGQVREAYKKFRESGGSDQSKLDRIFQDVLSLAREARRESGIDSNLISLGALASRELMERVAHSDHVAVIGAGSIAGSVARYLKKRGNFPVRVSSRCPRNAMELAMEVGGFGAGLDELAPMLEGVSGIVTATAAPHALLFKHHLEKAHRPLTIIDLGVPADCDDEVKTMDGVTYIRLEEIEAKAQVNSEERRQRGEIAARIIQEGALAWSRKH